MIVKLCNAHQLPAEGGMKAYRGNGFEICVTRVNHGLQAFDNNCPHQNAPLSAGELEGCMVVCPYHAWRFNVLTGQPEIAGDPPLRRYEIRQYDDEIFIQLPDNK